MSKLLNSIFISMISFSVLIVPFSLRAESYSCPSIQSIKDRTISKEFDWTVSEQTTLEQVLNVSELLEVRIENHGDFVGCIYKSTNDLVRLDAKPITVDCLLVPLSANWLMNDIGQSVCNDTDKMRCKFEVSCQLILDGP